MYELFTSQARRVMVLTQDEARRLGHNFISPDHIALGLLRNDTDSVRDGGRPRGRRSSSQRKGLFEALDLDPGHLKDELESGAERVAQMLRRLGGGGFQEFAPGNGPFSESAKTALEMSLREALALGHNWIGPGHLILGLLRKGEPDALVSSLDLETAKRIIADWLTPRPSYMAQLDSTRARGFDAITHAAISEASRRGELLGSHHLLIALAATKGTLARKILDDFGTTEAEIRKRAARLGTRGTLDDPPRRRVSVRVKGLEIEVDENVLEEALRAAAEKDPDLAEALRATLEDEEGQPEAGTSDH